jgi:lactoylglutathione lyase
MITSGFVNLYTADIDAGIRFYRDLLGAQETFRTPKEGTPTHIEFTLGGFGIGLGTVEAALRVHGVAATPGTPAMVLVLWTEDVDRLFERLTAAGAPAVQPPHPAGSRNRAALLRDPDGNLVEIIARVVPVPERGRYPARRGRRAVSGSPIASPRGGGPTRGAPSPE